MIERTINKEAICRVFNHPQVFPWLTDDTSPPFYEPVIHPQVTYLIDDTKEGVIRIDPLNGISCNVHIATTPIMWGSAHGFVRDAIKWGFENTKYMKVVAIVPAFNDLTLKLVKEVGFIQEGILKRSFLKNWKLHDQVIFGLSKRDTICQ